MNKWTAEFDETGGYDCMTGAWKIRDEQKRIIATVDQDDYGQEHCDYDFRSEEAERHARSIASLPELIEQIEALNTVVTSVLENKL